MTTPTCASSARPDTREMVLVHNVFRRLFGDLPRLVADVSRGDLARAAVLAELFDEIAAALDHHHTVEDEVLYPMLLPRVDVDRAVVLRGEEQHERVHELLHRAAGQATPFRATASDPARDALVMTLTELDAVLREHMIDEERHILPLVEEHLTAAEWEEFGERGRAGIARPRLLVRLGWIPDGVPAGRSTRPEPAGQ
jgi:hemerythrin-like domain-containing protein